MTKSRFTESYSLFLKLLILARKKAGFSQTQLANKLGKTQSYVSKCEIGERRLDLIEFLEILSVLKVSSKSIISEIEETLKKEKGFE